MTESEAKNWLDGFKIYDLGFTDKEIVICPSFNLLPIVKSYLLNHKFLIKVGAQDISPFDEGAYTGEVNGKQIKEFAQFVIVGHSERRKNFFENEKIVNAKITQALKNGLTPIVCISNLEQVKKTQEVLKNSTQFVIAYEPLFAIGSGTADTPENADQMCREIKSILGEVPTLYGGSVNKDNIRSFTNMLNNDGALVGKASLDPLEFLGIIKNA